MKAGRLGADDGGQVATQERRRPRRQDAEDEEYDRTSFNVAGWQDHPQYRTRGWRCQVEVYEDVDQTGSTSWTRLMSTETRARPSVR